MLNSWLDDDTQDDDDEDDYLFRKLKTWGGNEEDCVKRRGFQTDFLTSTKSCKDGVRFSFCNF